MSADAEFALTLAAEEISHLRRDLAAANAALTSVSDLLDQAREERDRERKHCEQMTLLADRFAAERDNARAELADPAVTTWTATMAEWEGKT